MRGSNSQRHPCSCWVEPWQLQTRPAVSPNLYQDSVLLFLPRCHRDNPFAKVILTLKGSHFQSVRPFPQNPDWLLVCATSILWVPRGSSCLGHFPRPPQHQETRVPDIQLFIQFGWISVNNRFATSITIILFLNVIFCSFYCCISTFSVVLVPALLCAPVLKVCCQTFLPHEPNTLLFSSC